MPELASPPYVMAQSPKHGKQPGNGAVGSNIVRGGVPSIIGVSQSKGPPLPELSLPANLSILRTSTLQQPANDGTILYGVQASQRPGLFEADATYRHDLKVRLEISGDLDTMAQNWSEEEWEARRRLVLFRRSQSKNTITTTFQPISEDDRPPNSVCISCIYWEEKNDCFVTNVDVLFLLEQLVAVRFTVEEKNRIRRNLEGFRPLTASKGSPESEEFFKIIMAFPSPKPRNIEKDIKVFPWKDLASALKRIVGKYVSNFP